LTAPNRFFLGSRFSSSSTKTLCCVIVDACWLVNL
jgi:hypothetical protein